MRSSAGSAHRVSGGQQAPGRFRPRPSAGPGSVSRASAVECLPFSHPRPCQRSWLPATLLERLAGVTPGLLLLLPQLEELALLPAPLVFRRPLAHNVFVFACLDHLTGNFGTEDRVMALAARRPVMVHQLVAAGHPLQKVLVADPALPSEDFCQFQGVVSRLHVIFGLSLFVRLSFLAHGLLSQRNDID